MLDGIMVVAFQPFAFKAVNLVVIALEGLSCVAAICFLAADDFAASDGRGARHLDSALIGRCLSTVA